MGRPAEKIRTIRPTCQFHRHYHHMTKTFAWSSNLILHRKTYTIAKAIKYPRFHLLSHVAKTITIQLNPAMSPPYTSAMTAKILHLDTSSPKRLRTAMRIFNLTFQMYTAPPQNYLRSIIFNATSAGPLNQTNQNTAAPNKYTVLNTNSPSSLNNSNKIYFADYCFETGSTRSLNGLPQFHAYSQQYQLKTTPRTSQHSFRFRTGVHQSKGTFHARLPLPNRLHL